MFGRCGEGPVVAPPQGLEKPIKPGRMLGLVGSASACLAGSLACCWARRIHAWGRFSIQARTDPRVHRTVRGPILTGCGNFPAAMSRYRNDLYSPVISRTSLSRSSRVCDQGAAFVTGCVIKAVFFLSLVVHLRERRWTPKC